MSSVNSSWQENTISEDFPFLNEAHKRYVTRVMEAASQQPLRSAEEAYREYDEIEQIMKPKRSGRQQTLLRPKR
jgi:23S rRNA maturation mini-RNase III